MLLTVGGLYPVNVTLELTMESHCTFLSNSIRKEIESHSGGSIALILSVGGVTTGA